MSNESGLERSMSEAAITTRDQLLGHIFELLDNHDSDGHLWKNKDVYTFLQAMAAWLNDAGRYYKNAGQDVHIEKPTWQLFADALSAASVYE
jgi:hypothetical protein